MFSGSFPRHGRAPLHIAPRRFLGAAGIFRLTRGLTARVVTILFQLLHSDTDWVHLRGTCCRIFIFWYQPKMVPDPPTAIAFGPDSDPGTDSSDDTVLQDTP